MATKGTAFKGIEVRSGGRSFRAKVMRNGVKVAKNFDTLAEAVRWREIMAGQLTGDTYEDRSKEKKLTLEQLLDRYLRDVTPKKSQSSQKAEANRIRAWKTQPWIKKENQARENWSKWSLMAVTAEQITAWRDMMEAAGKAPTTISNPLNLLSRVFKIARAEWGYKIENPCSGIARPKHREARDVPPDDRLESLLVQKAKESGAPWLATMITIAAWSAMRQGEVRLLRWEWIDFERSLINLPAPRTKGRISRGVAMTSRVSACLVNWLNGEQKPKDGLVFPSPLDATGAKPLSADTVVGAYRRLMDQIFEELDDDTREEIKPITFHDLRHWACTRLASLHRDVVDLSKTTGHKSLQQLARYYNERPEDRAARVVENEKIEESRRRQSAGGYQTVVSPAGFRHADPAVGAEHLDNGQPNKTEARSP